MRLISAESGVQVPAPPPFLSSPETWAGADLLCTPIAKNWSRFASMKLFLTVLGLLLIVEGLPYFAFPDRMQAVMREMLEMSPSSLRWIGLVSTLIGLGICYLVQRTDLFS
jgi:uncharacterized protein YjeT (DUF2065 family)